MPSQAARETDILESALAGYAAEGFDVFVEPSPAVLPPFMRSVRPDAVAISADRKIAFEVKHAARPGTNQTDRLRALLEDHPDWELHVLYVSPRLQTEIIDIATPLAIKKAIGQARELRDAYPPGSSLIVGWSALEAIARSLMPDRLGRPQPPFKLVEILATEGFVTPSEAENLRKIAAIRNSVAHGKLDAQIEPQLIDKFLDTLRTLLLLMPKTPRR
ncbi:MAG TPA: hypothetical protein VMB84_10800 [Stellaceae bacterium]|nr:hypothetical protein [Stellaceae bacterium]